MNFCAHSARSLRTEKLMFCFGSALFWTETKKCVYNNQQCFAFKIQMLTTSCRILTLILPSFIKLLELYKRLSLLSYYSFFMFGLFCPFSAWNLLNWIELYSFFLLHLRFKFDFRRFFCVLWQKLSKISNEYLYILHRIHTFNYDFISSLFPLLFELD